MSLFETRAQMFFHRTWIGFSVIKEIHSDWNIIKNLLLIYRHTHILTYTYTHCSIPAHMYPNTQTLYTCIYTQYIYIYIYIYTHTCTHRHSPAYIHTYLHISTHKHIYIHVYRHAYMCVCVRAHTHTKHIFL